MLIKQIIANNADIISDYENKTLTVRLHALPALRFNTATHHPTQSLNETETVFPGSDLRLIFDNYGCFGLRQVRRSEINDYTRHITQNGRNWFVNDARIELIKPLLATLPRKSAQKKRGSLTPAW